VYPLPQCHFFLSVSTLLFQTSSCPPNKVVSKPTPTIFFTIHFTSSGPLLSTNSGHFSCANFFSMRTMCNDWPRLDFLLQYFTLSFVPLNMLVMSRLSPPSFLILCTIFVQKTTDSCYFRTTWVIVMDSIPAFYRTNLCRFLCPLANPTHLVFLFSLFPFPQNLATSFF